MRKIAFIGYGALAQQIKNFINPSNEDKLIFFDDLAYEKKVLNAFKFNDFLNDNFKDFMFCVSLGYKHLDLKERIMNELIKNKRSLFSYKHPSSYIDKTAIIGDGVIIYPMCNIDYNVKIGVGTLLNNTVTISHDSIIGSCNFIAPGVVFSGNTKLGNKTFIGTGTVISNGLEIGDNCKIGIGSVVTKNVRNCTKGIGNPFKIIDNIDLI